MESFYGVLNAFLERKGYPKKTCPFCGGRSWTINNEKGIFKCFHCDLGGGIVKFATEYYSVVEPGAMELEGDFTAQNAVNAMDRFLGSRLPVPNTKVMCPSEDEKKPECPISRRNHVYRAMMEIFPLKEADLNSLLKRGYTKEQVEAYGYISLPQALEERKVLTKRLQKKTGDSLEGVPGFERGKDGDMIISDGGYAWRKKSLRLNRYDKDIVLFLIPSYDMYGNCQYFQIAWDKGMVGKNITVTTKKGTEERDFAKYTVFSTPKSKDGGSVCVNPGFVGFYKRNPDKNSVHKFIPNLNGQTRIPVIEGMLKTPLYYELIQKQEVCIAQVGVANLKPLKAFLKDLKKLNPQLEGLDCCYDMDRYTNPAVWKACVKLKDVAKSVGLDFRMRNWNPNYKGVDDLAYARIQGKDLTYDVSGYINYVRKHDLCRRDVTEEEIEETIRKFQR